MKPLSALKYYWENKKKSMLILSIFFLTVISISFISSLVNSAFVSAENVTIKPFNTASIVSASDGKFFLDNETLEKVKDYETVKKVVPVGVETTSYTSIMGNSAAFVLFTEDSVQEVIDSFRLRLKDGSLPAKDAYEVALHEDILRNKNLKVGDEFGDAADEKEWVRGRYKIVGSLTGGSVLSFGTKSYTTEALKDAGIDMDNHVAAVLVFPSGTIGSLNNDLQALNKTEARIYTYTSLRKDLDEQLSGIQSIIGIVMFVVIFALGVSIGAIIMIAYADRSGEFGILFAIGYSKRDVTKLICKEVGILSLISTAIGYGLSMVLLFLVDILIFSPGGKPLAVFSSFGLIFTLVVPVMVFACAVLPILRRFKRTDLVSVIEGR